MDAVARLCFLGVLRGRGAECRISSKRKQEQKELWRQRKSSEQTTEGTVSAVTENTLRLFLHIQSITFMLIFF